MQQEERPDGASRFAMLETIREFGAGAAGSSAAKRRRRASDTPPGAWISRNGRRRSVRTRRTRRWAGPARRRARQPAGGAGLGDRPGRCGDRAAAGDRDRLVLVRHRAGWRRADLGRAGARCAVRRRRLVRARALVTVGLACPEFTAILTARQRRCRGAVARARQPLSRDRGDRHWRVLRAGRLDLGEVRSREVSFRRLAIQESLGNTALIPCSAEQPRFRRLRAGRSRRRGGALRRALARFRAMGNTFGIGAHPDQPRRLARRRGDYARAAALYAEGLALRWDRWRQDQRRELPARVGAHRRARAAVRARPCACSPRPRRCARRSAPANRAATPRAEDGACGRPAPPSARRPLPRPGPPGGRCRWPKRSPRRWLCPSDAPDPIAARAAERHGLTAREFEVLRSPGRRGGPTPRLPTALFISRRTVTTHVTNIFAKLGVGNRVEAVDSRIATVSSAAMRGPLLRKRRSVLRQVVVVAGNSLRSNPTPVRCGRPRARRRLRPDRSPETGRLHRRRTASRPGRGGPP